MTLLIVYSVLIVVGLLAMLLAAYWSGYHDGHKEGAELENRRLNGDLTSNINLKEIGI
jgi:hypothetical protein